MVAVSKISRSKGLIKEVVAYLFILLFVYAAGSKVFDFETFTVQLAQSPLLSAYAGIIAWVVPGIEILIALLLVFPRARTFGLYAAFTLMVMFTAYIYIILNFSDFVPCSCGGVLEKLSWTQHLIFNVVFIVLAVGAILHASRFPKPGKLPTSYKAVFLALFIFAAFATLLVTLLFISSEKKLYRNDAFQRKYLPHAAEYLEDYELGSNTYYIAGFKDSIIYLGNLQAPLYLKSLDVSLHNINDFAVAISNSDLPYRRVRIRVEPPYFYLGDGTVPVIFRGNTINWKANLFSYKDAYFKQFEIVDSIRMGLASISNTTFTNMVGLLTKSATRDTVVFNETVISKQLGGVFDTDGLLLWNAKHKSLLYVYYYRNQYEVTDKNLKFRFSGKTIDTISRAILDIAHHRKKDQYKRGQSVVVNRHIATYGDYLFINSDRLGRYEDKTNANSAAIIDVYNIMGKNYEFSFYLNHQLNKKLDDFRINRDILIALVDGRLWIYKLKPERFGPGSNTTHTGQYQE